MIDANQRQFFCTNGYLHLPQAVDTEFVQAARQPDKYDVPALYAQTSLHAAMRRGVQARHPRHVQVATLTPAADRSGVPTLPVGHIDGRPTQYSGVPAGRLYSFTALLGIYLSDITDDFAGNLVVWPGSHRLNANALLQEDFVVESLIRQQPQIALPEPVQLKVKAGDAVLLHYLTLHAAAPNHSDNTRHAIYFRFKHPKHDDVRGDALTRLWRHWSLDEI